MTVSPGAGRRPVGPTVWRPVPDPASAPVCGHLHSAPGGTLDESARRLSHEELAAAMALVGDGHRVVSLPEMGRPGRHPDLEVCGVPVEIKSFAPPGSRRRDPTPQSVFNKLADAAGQASHVVLVGRGSGLTPSTVRRGLARYAAADRPVPPLASVRVLGDGFDLSWRAGPAHERRPAPSLRTGL